MDEQQNNDTQNGASLQPQPTEPTVASSRPKQQTVIQPSPASTTPTQPITPQMTQSQPSMPTVEQATTPNTTPSVQPQVLVTQPTQPNSSGPMPVSMGKPTRSKWFLPAIFAGFIVLGGGAAAYVSVFQKSPESLLKSALNNTADGIEQYLDNTLNLEQQKGFKIDGSFKVASPVAIDGSMKGQWYDSNGSLTANVGAGGVRLETELKTVAQVEGATPDIFMKISGLEGIDSLIQSIAGYSGSQVGTQFSEVNGQWYFIDHTLIDQYTASAGGSNEASMFTEEDAKEAIDKMMVVLRERMFSVDDDKAIFKVTDEIGKENYEGTDSYKMSVKVDQNNFKDFVVALKDAAKETKLNDLMTQGSDSITLEEALSFDELIRELEKADFSDATADVWVESRGGFIRNVRFYPIDDKKDSNFVDFGMNYTGGDVFPFLIRATVADEGVEGTLAFGFDINQQNGDVSMSLTVDMGGDGIYVKADGELSITGSDEQVSIDKPEGAKSYLELLSSLSSGFLGDTTGPEAFDSLESFDTLTPTYPLDDIEL